MIHIFIINSYAGQQGFAETLRGRLDKLDGFQYFIFNTKEAGFETELVRKVQKIFMDEELRIYSCGGSGTFMNVINGINDFSRVELAFFPCGLTNDFLKTFGKDAKKFDDIDNLIYGDIVLCDYIKSDNSVAINTVSCGFDLNLCKSIEEFRYLSIFGKNIPYSLSVVNSMFFSKLDDYEISIDGEKLVGVMSQIILGNGNCIGGNIHFTSDNKTGDGKGTYMIMPSKSRFSLFRLLSKMKKSDFEKVEAESFHGFWEKVSIKRRDGVPFKVNFDGEMQNEQAEWNFRIINKGLKLVVPKGVKINE